MAKTASNPSPWSIRILTVAGIPIRIHATFLLILVWIGVLAYRQESRVFALILPSLFVCVVLHELGHALVGKSFGVNTRDITLYPIGGVAMLESRPKPHQELWIALAGPAVNVIIAGIVLAIYLALYGTMPSFADGLAGKNYLEGLYTLNLILPAFNMIPAFPMDGGRVLRSLLAMFMEPVRATQIAGAIGQAFAMLFGFAGLLSGNILWVLIAFFIFMGAGQEVQMTIGISLLEGKKVGDAMMTRFRTIASGESLRAAASMLLEGSQTTFPVTNGDEIVGLLRRDDIIRGLSEAGPEGYVAGFMSREFPSFQVSLPLEEAFEKASSEQGLPALVYNDGKLVGVLSGENLGEFLMVRQAMKGS